MAEKNKKLDEGKIQEMLTDYYRRPRWKHFVRIFGFFVLLALPFVLIAADLQLLATQANSPKFLKHILMDVFLVIVDLTMLVPIFFEVDSVQAAPDKLTLKTIFWKGVIPYSEIVAFKTPSLWQFALVRTKRCFYLINKKDIPRYEELVKTIAEKAPAEAHSHNK